MYKLQVLINDQWEYVFCRNQRVTDPITTKDKQKALRANDHSFHYFNMHYGNHKFRSSK